MFQNYFLLVKEVFLELLLRTLCLLLYRQYFNISLQEIVLLLLFVLLLLLSLIKWGKTFITILLIEIITITALCIILFLNVFFSTFLVLITFFVGESLIILAAMFRSLRNLGRIQGGLLLF